MRTASARLRGAGLADRRRTGGCAPCPRTGTAGRRSRRPVSRRGRRAAPRSRGRSAATPRPARLSVASAGSTTRSPACTRRTASASWAGRGVLDHEPGRAGLHRPAQVAGPAERRHDQHPACSGTAARTAAVAAMPSSPGISTSSRATSGRCSRDRRHAPRRRGRPRRPPRGRARGRAARPARRGPAPGRRRAAAGSSRHDDLGGEKPGLQRAATTTAAPDRGRPLAQAGQAVAPGGGRRPRPGPAPSSRTSALRRRSAGPRSVRAPECRITLVTPSRTVQANSSRSSAGTSSVEFGSSASISAAGSAVRARASSPGRVSSR